MNSPWWKKAFAFARCGRKQSGDIKSAMIPVKYRGEKTSVCLQACLKAIMIIFCSWDLWILPFSHFRFWFILTMKQQGFIWTRHHKSQGCVMMAQVKILHVKSVENASKRPTWKTKEQSFPKYGTLLRKQWVWNEKSLTHLSFFYFSHYEAFALPTRALITC